MPRSHLAVFAALALVPAASLATVVKALSVEQMTAIARVVVHGSVSHVEAHWDDGHRSIWTYSEIVVRETLKGTKSSTLLIKQPGGVIGAVGQQVAGAAQFTPGEEVVLFLEPAVDEPNAFVVLAMSAGKVTLEDSGTRKLAKRDLKGLSFARPGKSTLTRPVDERDVVGFADAFLAKVRAASKVGAK